MKVYPTTGALILTGLALIFSLISCSPKYVVRGRVVDAETRQPIKGAAVAIKWYTDYPDKQSAKMKTVDAVQALSDDKGVFNIPEYPDKHYVLGVYKNGYICWSSQDIFLMPHRKSRAHKYQKRKSLQIADGMEVELAPLHKNHPKDLHAAFTVMVAGESTDSDLGPFHQAIQSEYQLLRDKLRKDFQKQVGAK
jgi:hypothetical protein